MPDSMDGADRELTENEKQILKTLNNYREQKIISEEIYQGFIQRIGNKQITLAELSQILKRMENLIKKGVLILGSGKNNLRKY